MQNNTKGAIYKITCSLFYAIVSGLQKMLCLAGQNSILIFQNIFGFAILSAYMIFTKQPFKTKNIGLQISRGIIYSAGILFWYKAVEIMPITKVIVLSLIGPFFTLLFGRFLLSEKFGLKRIVIVLLGVVGTLMIIIQKDVINFDAHDIDLRMLYPVLGHVLFSLCNVFSKFLTKKGDNPTTIVWYSFLFSIPVIAIISPVQIPTFVNLSYILLIAFFAVSAYVMHSEAIKLADITFLIQFGPMRPVFAFLIGIIFFKEQIGLMSTIGAILVLLVITCAQYVDKKTQ